MKKMISILLVLITSMASTFTTASANLQSDKIKKNASYQKLSNSTEVKSVTLNRTSNKLIGTWDVVNSADGSISKTINIKSIGKSSLGFTFIFDTIGSTSGNPLDENLKGFIQGNRLFFASPSLGITEFYAFKLAKGFISGAGEEILITDFDCEFDETPVASCAILADTVTITNARLFIKR